MGSELGMLISARRDELHMTRQQLAEESELSYPYLSQIETGQRTPALKAIRQISRALGLEVSELASLAAPDAWGGASGSHHGAPIDAERAVQLLEAYRAKVLPSVRQRLKAVPPLARLQLLAELITEAAGEAAEEQI